MLKATFPSGTYYIGDPSMSYGAKKVITGLSQYGVISTMVIKVVLK